MQEIIELTNSKSNLVFKDSPKQNPKDRELCILKAKLSLNWVPEVSRKSGLRKLLKISEINFL